jgi:hypothetical protein
MITRAQGFVLVHNIVPQATTTQSSEENMQDTSLNLSENKKFLLALIFASLNTS